MFTPIIFSKCFCGFCGLSLYIVEVMFIRLGRLFQYLSHKGRL